MWVRRLWRYVRGEVRFHAEGGLCEYFLNLLSEGDSPIRLWDIVIEEGEVTASCRAADYGRLRPFARRTGTRVRSLSHRGLTKHTRSFRRHPGYVVGAVLAAAIYMWLGSHIWVVEVTGVEDALKESVVQVLRDGGVGVGMPMKEADLTAVRMNVIACVPQVHHISVYIDGCVAKADVTLADEDRLPPDDTPTNLVARKDGLIVSMRVSMGEKAVKVGEAVVAGDLLVCGMTETTKGVLLHHSRAVIMAQTEQTITACASRHETVTVGGRRIVCPTVRFLSLSLPLYSSGAAVEDWTVTRETRELTLFGTTLPVGISYVCYTEPAEKAVVYTDEETEALASARLQEAIRDALPSAQLVDVKTDTVWEGDICRMTARVTAIEDIAVEQRLLIDAE